MLRPRREAPLPRMTSKGNISRIRLLRCEGGSKSFFFFCLLRMCMVSHSFVCGFLWFSSFPFDPCNRIISSVWLPYIADPSAAANAGSYLYISILLRNLGGGRLA
jgi:hypothetical protein